MNKRQIKLSVFTFVVVITSAVSAAAQTPAPPHQMFLPAVFRPAQTRVLTATGDAFVIENFPNDNTGSENYLVAGIDIYGEPRFGRMRSLINFDVPPPPTSTVERAILRIYFEEAVDEPDKTQSLVVLQPYHAWNESTVTFANYGGCDVGYSGEPVATVPINSSAPAGYIDIDVTSVVSNWLTGMEVYTGFCLAQPEGGTNFPAYYFFTSREGAHPPELVLTY